VGRAWLCCGVLFHLIGSWAEDSFLSFLFSWTLMLYDKRVIFLPGLLGGCVIGLKMVFEVMVMEAVHELIHCISLFLTLNFQG
jgi:hypothetical protein